MQKETKAQAIRRMLEAGCSNKDIVTKLKVEPRVVYNARYVHNKSRGLGAIGVKKSELASKPRHNEPIYIFLDSPKPTKLTLWQRIKGWFRG
jgi:hypothetical protein